MVNCTKKDLFRTDLIQSYIDSDWQSFAQKYAYIEFAVQLAFVSLMMIQFWQFNEDEATLENESQLFRKTVPILTAILLVVNILKEIGQVITEGKSYFTDFENLTDLTIYVLVIICQYFYWFTGKRVNGYYFPDSNTYSEDQPDDTDPKSGSVFERILLPTIILLHFNLILQHMVAFKIFRQYIVVILQTV